MSGDLSNLIRRLRRFGERWPHEEPTAEMCREAADELTRLVAEAKRLIRLPNGDWIDPQRIDFIMACVAVKCLSSTIPDRVMVRAGGELLIVDCESYDDAAALADRIAAAVNGGGWEP